jgi:signal transduction histidine kinase
MNAHDAIVENQQDDGMITLEVSFDEEQQCIAVAVTDNGPGIPTDIREQIFSPFFTTKPVGEGTGLGLHVCQQVVQNVGGTIQVESELGQFTRFLVRLPVIKSVSRIN